MSNKTKTLVIFSPAFPANETDDNWIPLLQNFVKAINRNFPRLNVFVFSFQYPYAAATYKWHGNTVISFNGRHKKKVSRLIMWLKIFLRVRQLTQRKSILGILSLWCGECAFVGKYCSKLVRIKHYCWIQGQDARKSNTYVKKIKPAADELIALSDFLAQEFYTSHGVKPKHVIPNAIDVSSFGKLPEQKDVDIIGAGSFHVLKQYNVFAEIVAAVRNHFPFVKVILCGDGEERERIESMITAFFLQQNITLTGLLPHSKGLQQMQRAKIFLHPSSYEGFSTACLEALYAGAHVVSFTKPMAYEIKNWHVVSTKEEMLQKVLQLLKDEQIKYEAVLVYSIDDTAKAMMNLFEV